MLREYLFDTDPYAGFPADDYPLDCSGFHLPERVLGLVAEARPARIIEVGTWLGQSAFCMADKLARANVAFELVCVDTWLGSSEMWLTETRSEFGRRSGLRLRHGHPTVYNQFLANVIKLGYERSIIPFPVTSTIAAQVLRHIGYTARFVYIDGSHDAVDVGHDVPAYWDLVEGGGILCGDDYSWPGVRAAVDGLVARTGCRLETFPEESSWLVRKSSR